MDFLKKLFTVLLAFLMLSLYFPTMSFAEEQLLIAQARITKHRPQVVSPPEEDIPTVMVKKTRLWPCCAGLGLAAIAAAAAAGAAEEEEKKGNIAFSW